MKRGLIVAPAWLTALAVFNSGTLRWQCSTAAYCAGSSAAQQRQYILPCDGSSANSKQDTYTHHTVLAVYNPVQ